MTVREISEYLARQGIENSLWEALLLAEHFTGRSRSLWRADLDQDIPHPSLTDAVQKRGGRYPLQYILGTWEFMGLDFSVREGCLIPRADTEILVEAAIRHIRQTGKAHVKVLDLCTGSGCILASVLHYCPEAIGTAVELYADAMAVAKENFARLGLTDRIRCISGDIRNDVFSADETFDLILSNPPYISTEEMAGLAPELSAEPVTALTDGGDGLSLYRSIFKNYLSHLSSDGILALEHGSTQSAAILQMGKTFNALGTVLHDYAGLPRCTILKKSCSSF